MRTNDKSKIIKILREMPFISYAAKNIGVSRSTVYRWIENDPKFKFGLTQAMEEGLKMINDIAEMALINQIKKGNMKAITYHLSHNNPKYIPKRSIYVEPPKEIKNGETCPTCKHEKTEITSKSELLSRLELLKLYASDLPDDDLSDESKK